LLSANSYQTISSAGQINIAPPVNQSILLQPTGTGYVNLSNTVYEDNTTQALADYYETFVKLTTTNSTATTLYSFTASALQTVKIQIELCGFNTTSGAAYGYWTGFKCVFTPATIASTSFNPATQSGAAALNVYSAINSGIVANPISFLFASPTLAIQVTGIIATNIDWTAKIKVQRAKRECS